MKLRVTALALAALALAGCGGAMPEAELAAQKQVQSSATATTRHTDAPLIVTWLPCKALQQVATVSGATSQNLQNLQACAAQGTNFNTLVKFRGPANLPQGTRLCILPYNDANTFTETCFGFTGDQDFSVNSNNFHSVAVVLETDLAAFKGYLNGTGAQRPPYSAGKLR